MLISRGHAPPHTCKERVIRYAPTRARARTVTFGSISNKEQIEAIPIPRTEPLPAKATATAILLWFAPSLSTREDRLAKAVMLGTCLTFVPHRAALSRDVRFQDTRCLRNWQWITTAVFDDLTPKLTAWLNNRSNLSWKIRSTDTLQALEANKRSLRENFVNNIRRHVARFDRVIFPC
jgi:hypothetical protein